MSVYSPGNLTQPASWYEAEADKVKPVNLAICLGDAFSWSFGIAFFSLTTIVPLFLRQLKASNLIIGLLPAIFSLGYSLPGLLVAKQISRMPLAKWWLLIVAILERIPLLMFGLLIPVLGPRRPEAVLWLFIGGCAFHALCLGLNQPAYWSVVGKVIPTRRRGRMYGWAGVGAGIVGFSIDPITRHLLTPVGIASLHGFATCFLVGTIVLFLGALPFGLLDEPRSGIHLAADSGSDRSIVGFWADAKKLLKENKALRWMLTGQCFISLATMAQPFFVMDYSSRFHVSSSAIAAFTTIGAVLGAFGSIVWGAWGDHRGNKGVLIVSEALALGAALIAVAAPPPEAFYAIFAFSALSSTGIGIASYNIVMEFAGDFRNIPHLTSLFNAVVAPFRTIAPLAGGLLADHFGYKWVFVFSAMFAIGGLVFTTRMVEPRKIT